MATRLNPYLAFDGNARFGEYGDAPNPDGVMHALLESGGGLTLMASDPPPGMEPNPGENITVSLSGDDAPELRQYWEKLSDGGTVKMPLEKQMWGDEFGMCVDRFGTPWMVNITAPQ